MGNPFNDPILTLWHVREDGTKYTVPIENEPHQVKNGQFTLVQIPSEFNKVFVTNRTMYEIKKNKKITSPNEFLVDYTWGIVYTHPDLEGEYLTVNYSAMGVHLIPSNRVYDTTTGEGLQPPLKTLEDYINSIKPYGYKNDFNLEIPYTPNSMVSYDYGVYRCKKLSLGILPTNTEYWECMMSVKAEATHAQTQGDYAKAQGDELNTIIDNFIDKGIYDDAVQYYPKNIVKYKGSSFINKVACKGVKPYDTSKWQELASGFYFQGEFNYDRTYETGDLINFGVENAIYECIKNTTAGISPYNETYWFKREDITKAVKIVNNFDNNIEAIYIAYDSNIEIAHNLNAYPDCNVVCVSGAGFGNNGFGLSGFATATVYQVKTRLEYVDMNTVKIYLDEKFSGTPTITKIDTNNYKVQFVNEGVELRVILKTY